MLQDTSLDAYMKIRNLKGRRKEVYEAVQRWPKSTDMELTHYLNYYDPNKVRPRRRDLVKDGLVKSAGTRKCRVTNMLVNIWVTL